MIPNYYAILGVPRGASSAEIKRAYRHLARLHHPDLNTRTEDAQIKRVNEAYAILGDAQKRLAYDLQWRQEQQRLEAVRRQQEQAQREPEITWVQGVIGFVREFKKGMREE